ncbi:MAG: c-type cytochrome [Rhodoferax sp.]|nr:c-type cytochrome [Rhodoferax sp.]
MYFKSIFNKLIALVCMCLAASAFAAEVAVAPVLDRTGLAPSGDAWLKTNPYRGNQRAIEVGQSAFNQSCARCHGHDANTAGGVPAPDLRRLHSYCRRIANSTLQAACLSDNDQYFKKSVLQGKTVVGIVHMPAWKDVLIQDDIWAIQAFIESRVSAKPP